MTELGLSGRELGAHVLALLRIDGYAVRLHANRVTTKPHLARDHQLWEHLGTVGEFLRARCERCTEPDRHGLHLAYWGQWLCGHCCKVLGEPGGVNDRNGWPPVPEDLAA